MNVRDVRELVRRGRAIKGPSYHAGRRGIAFVEILTALQSCFRVEPDVRESAGGGRLHPRGWFALANLPNRRRLRVDFDLEEDEDGNLLMIVTAYEV